VRTTREASRRRSNCGSDRTQEIIVIGVVVMLLFGTTILPRLARSGGRRLRESRDVLAQSKIELEAGLKDAEAVPVTEQHPTPQRAPLR
jgi:Sec-independent protein translocase protein TatA